ncbi:trypsin-like serine protease [Agrococcus jejuensis]|uniref:trypsin-like serine protease n=1 Tax=Agrococcus jejuensis TaxID=399736 RepID=UPI0011AA4BE9|nr:trypsin-like serine protease [Agrococcus jejuensis]
MRRATSWVTLAAALLVAPLVAPVAATAVPAAPAAASADPLETQRTQLAVLDDVARWDALQSVSHLGSTAIVPETGAITIGWVGDVPEAVRALAVADGITVSFVAEAQSAAALTSGLLDAAASLPSDAPLAFEVDGEAVTVAVPTPEAAEAAGVEALPLDAAGIAAIEDAVADATEADVDVAVEAVDAVPDTTARRGDVQDLLGGSTYATRLPSGANQWCTSGFQAVSGHFQHFITAAHCSNWADGLSVLASGGQTLGVTTGADVLVRGADSHDLQLVRLGLDVRNRPDIYTSDSTSLRISGWLRSLPAGTYLCKSGTTSGNACNLQVTGPGVACYALASGGAQCVDIVRVSSTSGTAFCLGDSGGPVYTWGDGGSALAAGVVSGVRLAAAGDRCSTLGYVAPIADLMRVIPGVQLRAITF